MEAFFQMLANQQPRGLSNFIKEIRNCAGKEEERVRVDKELGNIRLKFSNSGNLNSYQKKKYVWKMCYIYMLGYEVDFGHTEFIALISSTKYREKCVGYMAVSLMIRADDELLTLIINSIRNDLVSGNHNSVCLALAVLSNLPSSELSETLCSDVENLLLGSGQLHSNDNPNIQITEEQIEADRNCIKKKAALCLLRLYRTNPDILVMDDWNAQLSTLLGSRDLGVLTSVMSLVLDLTMASPDHFMGLAECVTLILDRLINKRDIPQMYNYYKIPCPWLQIKCLRWLSIYGPHSFPPQTTQAIESAIRGILENSSIVVDNKNNAHHAILIETVNLVIAWGAKGENMQSGMREQCMVFLARFLCTEDQNIKFLGLDAMVRMQRQEGTQLSQEEQDIVVGILQDSDVTVRKRALDVLYLGCRETNAEPVVRELVKVLPESDAAMKEVMVVKIAILAERFAPNLQWYISTMMEVILSSGDYVSDEVWHRIVQIVTNNEATRAYACETVLATLRASSYNNDTTIALGGYLLGEFGVSICMEEGMSGYEQFATLQENFPRATSKTQSLLLTAYMKLHNCYEADVKQLVGAFLTKLSTSSNLELQQRSNEYLHLAQISSGTVESVLEPMPAYPERQNILITRMEEIERAEEKDTQAFSGPRAKIVGGVDDDVSALTTPTSGGQRSPSRDTVVTDLLDIGSATPPPVPVGTPATEPSPAHARTGDGEPLSYNPALRPAMKAWFNRLVLKAPGILFENEFLSVKATSEFREYKGKLTLHISNTSTGEIGQLSCTAAGDEELKLMLQNPAVSTLGMSESCRCELTVECMRPFTRPPLLSLSFSHGSKAFLYLLPLPIAASSFLLPVAMNDKEGFMTRWRGLEGGNREAQEVISSSRPVSVQVCHVLYCVLQSAQPLPNLTLVFNALPFDLLMTPFSTNNPTPGALRPSSASPTHKSLTLDLFFSPFPFTSLYFIPAHECYSWKRLRGSRACTRWRCGCRGRFDRNGGGYFPYGHAQCRWRLCQCRRYGSP
jgi:AP-2 complex subunit alpha